MKKQNHGYLLYVTKMELLQLASITEEKLDLGYKATENKPAFTAAELWGIQRQRRAFVKRRASF